MTYTDSNRPLLDEAQLTALQDAQVVTRLSGRSQCMMLRIGNRNVPTVVAYGLPIDFRIFCATLLRAASGYSSIANGMDDALKEFWQQVGYKPKNEDVFQTVLAHLRVAASDGNIENAFNRDADLLPLMAEVHSQMQELQS